MTVGLFVCAFVLLALGLVVAWHSDEDVRPDSRGVQDAPAPFTQPPGIEDADPMVLCPSCRCMGHHSLDLVPAKPPAPIKVVEHPDGTVDEIFTWQSAAGTAAHYRRECVFCEHVWSVPVPKDGTP